MIRRRTLAALTVVGTIVGLIALPVAAATPPSAPGSADPGSLAVSFESPPPELEPTSFATVDLPNTAPGVMPAVAITEGGGALVIDADGFEAIPVAPDGAVGQPVLLQIIPQDPISGPGDMLYGLFADDFSETLSLVGIPTTGVNVGGYIVAAELDPAAYAEPTLFPLGHGSTGVVDRMHDDAGELLGYVGADGTPTALARPVPVMSIGGDGVVTADYGDATIAAGVVTSWSLAIERAPDSPPPSNGEEAPVPLAGGAAVWLTSIGGPDPDDATRPTMPVLVELLPDGTARWWSVPADWTVVAMDVYGVLLARRTTDGLELAVWATGSTPGTADGPVASDPVGSAPVASEPGDTESAGSESAGSEPGVTEVSAPGDATCPTYTQAVSYPVRLCDEGTGVSVIQTALNAAGSALRSDGSFGPATDAAVRSFQQANGLAVDGLVGPVTWAALAQVLGDNGIANGEDTDGNGVVDPWEMSVPG